jgi:uncharacterized protein YkwD
MQQHAHGSRLQGCLHLPRWTRQHGRDPRGLLGALLATCAAALASGSATAAAAVPAAAAAYGCRGAHLRPNAGNLAAVEAATLCIVNRVRTAHDAPRLHANHALAHVAAGQIAAMMHGDYFADVSPSGQTPLSLVAGTAYPAHAASFAVGLNLAYGTGHDVTPAHIVAEWMSSPPHRAIMLSQQYRNAGVAVAPTVPAFLRVGRPEATYAFEFGVRF